MTDYNYIPLAASEVPIKIQPEVDGKRYIWNVKYNEDFDRYTVEISDADGTLLYTTRLVIDGNILSAGIVLELTSAIVPRDRVDGSSEHVTSDNLGDRVKLYVEAA